MARREDVAENGRRRSAARRSSSTSLSPPRKCSRAPASRSDTRNSQKDWRRISDSEDEAMAPLDRRRNSDQKLPLEDSRGRGRGRGRDGGDGEGRAYRDRNKYGDDRDDREYQDRCRGREDRVFDDGKGRERGRAGEGHDRKRRDDESRVSRDGESPQRKAGFYHGREHEGRHHNRNREEEFDEERHPTKKGEDDFGQERHRSKKSRDSYGEGRHYDRKMEYDSGDDRVTHGYSSSNDLHLPDLYGIYRAKVQSVRPFGIFVRIEGFFKQGLVHVSHLSDHEVTDREDSDEVKVQAIGTIASEGDDVWVKVISLRDEGGGNVKIGCSLKLVSQSTGKDLDPSNVKLDQQQKFKGSRTDPKKLVLDAIYNVVCSRCGGHGHLKTECFASGDRTYELIPEEADEFAEEHSKPSSQGQMLSGSTSTMPGFGRGRSMVLPAWMTHGIEANAKHTGDELDIANKEKKKKKKQRKASELPENVTTVSEALALLAQVKKEKKKKKHRKKDGGKRKEERSRKH